MKMKELEVPGDSAQRRRENTSPAPEKEDLGCASKIVSGRERAEIDRLSPPALLKQFEEILASKPEDKNKLFAWDK
ncbi:hypothetical protein F2Q68_00043674 [Brassica cretica]|uniref:Uncharacterized protein n=1 Tax=Brassica cretica TaxID=69181 RepID=A0A8S9LTE6_BRACR|nr:hypothetical protein F2Q68_00043674 [Brassica cretica]